MKDAHREKLRQLPKERKLYLLQQNQHIKDNRTADKQARKSMPTSNSSTSIFPAKALRQKAAMKRSETSTRLLFPTNQNQHKLKQLGNSSSHRSLASTLISNESTEDISILLKNEELLSPPASPQTITNNSINTTSQKKNGQSMKKEMEHELQYGEDPMELNTDIVSSRKSSIASIANTPIDPKSSDNNMDSNDPTTQKAGPIVDKRAATYKYARRNLASTITNTNRSKVGSMILEFNALAHKLEDTVSDDSAAWLLLDNKTLPRHYMNTTRSNSINHHPSVSNLFPTTSTAHAGNKSPTALTEASSSSSLLSNSYAYQSLTRKDGSHLAKMTSAPVKEESIKRGRDRNSPYFYVEKLKSR